MKTKESTFLNLLTFLRRLVSILLLILSNFANIRKKGKSTKFNKKITESNKKTNTLTFKIITFAILEFLY